MKRERSKRQFLKLSTGLIATLPGCSSFNDDARSTGNETTTATEEASISTTTRSRRTRRENETTTETTAQSTTTESTTRLASTNPPRFSLTFEQEDVTSDFLRVSRLVLRGGTGHEVGTYDVGTDVSGLSFVRGASDLRQSDNRTWRSFDSPTTIALTDAHELDSYSAFEIECQPRTLETPLRITSHGETRNTVTVTSDGWQTRHFSLLYS